MRDREPSEATTGGAQRLPHHPHPFLFGTDLISDGSGTGGRKRKAARVDPARISAGNFQRRRWEGAAESHTQARAAPAPGGPRGQGEEGQNAERERRPANTPPHSHHLPDGSSLNPDEKLHKHQTHSAQVGQEH